MINKLGFGFLRLPKTASGFDIDTICQMTDLYLEKGHRYFDTCYTYLNGESEGVIRKCLTSRKDRGAYELTDKLPGYLCKTKEDAARLFEEELKNCGVDYFDVYMLHWLNRENYETAQRLEQFEFISKLKAEGKTKRIGFTYHDNAQLLDRILTEHPEVDIVQLQINYLDWSSPGIDSRKCYEVCEKHNKAISVVNPIKGGTLAALPDEARMVLRRLHRDWSPADWALRFAQSLPQVEVCLSGMETTEQMESNLQPFAPLGLKEIIALQKVRDIIKNETAIPCTGCGYCSGTCPMNIAIQDCFNIYNELQRSPQEALKIRPAYRTLCQEKHTGADCINCGQCIERCPQNIDIPGFLIEIMEAFA